MNIDVVEPCRNELLQSKKKTAVKLLNGQFTVPLLLVETLVKTEQDRPPLLLTRTRLPAVLFLLPRRLRSKTQLLYREALPLVSLEINNDPLGDSTHLARTTLSLETL